MRVDRAAAAGVCPDWGWVRGELALVPCAPPRGRVWSGAWEVVHRPTGHAVVKLDGDRAAALDAGEALQRLGDWGFDTLDGWRNRDPDMEVRVRAWAATAPCVRIDAEGERYEAAALEIAAGRF